MTKKKVVALSVAQSQHLVESLNKEGLSLKQIAEKAGTTDSYVKQILTGRRAFQAHHVQNMEGDGVNVMGRIVAEQALELGETLCRQGRKLAAAACRRGRKIGDAVDDGMEKVDNVVDAGVILAQRGAKNLLKRVSNVLDKALNKKDEN